MKHYLNLFRWQNVSLVLVSMSIILVFLISPLLGLNVFEHGLSLMEFALLVLATVFIAIGGNIVNDIFDINPDSINKPGKNVVGRKVSISTSWVLYWVFTIGGILCGTLLSYFLNRLNYGLIFLFCAGLLWFYSQKYKSQPLVGNVVIASLSALSFGLVWLFQFFALSFKAELFASLQPKFGMVNRMVLVYMAFAFLISLLREVIKDIEDYKGDDRFGCRTFAVVYGIDKAKSLFNILLIIVIIAVLSIQYYFFKATLIFHFWYFFIIDLLFVIVFYKSFLSKEKNDFAQISRILKLIMLVGVLSMSIFYFY